MLLVDIALRRHRRHCVQRRHAGRAPGLARQRRVRPLHLLAEAVGDHGEHVLRLRGDAVGVALATGAHIFVDEHATGEQRDTARQGTRRHALRHGRSVAVHTGNTDQRPVNARTNTFDQTIGMPVAIYIDVGPAVAADDVRIPGTQFDHAR